MLDSSALMLHCSVSQQHEQFNKINNLAM